MPLLIVLGKPGKYSLKRQRAQPVEESEAPSSEEEGAKKRGGVGRAQPARSLRSLETELGVIGEGLCLRLTRQCIRARSWRAGHAFLHCCARRMEGIRDFSRSFIVCVYVCVLVCGCLCAACAGLYADIRMDVPVTLTDRMRQEQETLEKQAELERIQKVCACSICARPVSSLSPRIVCVVFFVCCRGCVK